MGYYVHIMQNIKGIFAIRNYNLTILRGQGVFNLAIFKLSLREFLTEKNYRYQMLITINRNFSKFKIDLLLHFRTRDLILLVYLCSLCYFETFNEANFRFRPEKWKY